MADLDPHWLTRMEAVGKAQGRYLWILLVAMVFYAALQSGIGSSPSDPLLKVPFVELPLSGAVVLASGTTVLSLLVLAIVGSMRALKRARDALVLSGGAEEFDTHPNLIDLAFYMTPGSPRLIIVDMAYFVYVGFLLLGLGEAAWLWLHTVEAAKSQPWWYLFAAVGAVFWIPALCLVAARGYGRLRAWLRA